MTIYNLSNFEDFFGTLDKCESDIILTTEDGHEYDWGMQKDAFRSLLGSLHTPKLRRLGLRATSPNDQGHIFQFLVSANQRTA